MDWSPETSHAQSGLAQKLISWRGHPVLVASLVRFSLPLVSILGRESVVKYLQGQEHAATKVLALSKERSKHIDNVPF